MSSDKLNELIKTIDRMKRKILNTCGEGFDDSADIDGRIQKYKIINLKNPEDYKDELSNLMIWIWSYKDHFTKRLIETGISKNQAKKQVNKIIENSTDLKICMDVANGIKHAGLDNCGWTNLNPELGDVGFNVPMKSLKELLFKYDGEIVIDIAKPENAIFHAKIRDKNGNILGDAVDIMLNAIKEWDKLEMVSVRGK